MLTYVTPQLNNWVICMYTLIHTNICKIGCNTISAVREQSSKLKFSKSKRIENYAIYCFEFFQVYLIQDNIFNDSSVSQSPALA